jgi:hypothetical protein
MQNAMQTGFMSNAESADLHAPGPSNALRNWLHRKNINAEDAEPAPVTQPEAVPDATEDADNADHVFPGEPPSERLYGRGCRCADCRGCHNAEVRRRYHERKNGTFIDRRRKPPQAVATPVLPVPAALPVSPEGSWVGLPAQPVSVDSGAAEDRPWRVRVVTIDGKPVVARA